MFTRDGVSVVVAGTLFFNPAMFNSVEAAGQSTFSLAQKSSFSFGPPLFIKVELSAHSGNYKDG